MPFLGFFSTFAIPIHFHYPGVPEISVVHENTFFTFKPFGGGFYQKNSFLFFLWYQYLFSSFFFELLPIICHMHLSELVIGTPFIQVSISTYINNGTEKVPTSAEIGVRVQRSTSKIWNSPHQLHIQSKTVLCIIINIM